MGFAFYELSGGADYAPASNSIQARAAERAETSSAQAVAGVRPLERKDDATAIRMARASDTSARVSPSKPTQERFEITLTSSDETYMPTETASRVDANAAAAAIDAAVESAMQAALLADTLADTRTNTLTDTLADTLEAPLTEQTLQPVFSLETYAEASAQGLLVPRPTGDEIREVTGNMVNMRTGPGTEFSTVGKLAKGTQVTVLAEPGEGWIMLEVRETGETGWMADWLVTASN